MAISVVGISAMVFQSLHHTFLDIDCEALHQGQVGEMPTGLLRESEGVIRISVIGATENATSSLHAAAELWRLLANCSPYLGPFFQSNPPAAVSLHERAIINTQIQMAEWHGPAHLKAERRSRCGVSEHATVGVERWLVPCVRDAAYHGRSVEGNAPHVSVRLQRIGGA